MGRKTSCLHETTVYTNSNIWSNFVLSICVIFTEIYLVLSCLDPAVEGRLLRGSWRSLVCRPRKDGTSHANSCWKWRAAWKKKSYQCNCCCQEEREDQRRFKGAQCSIRMPSQIRMKRLQLLKWKLLRFLWRIKMPSQRLQY